MPLVNFNKMMKCALKGGYAVGYFESWDMDSIEAVLSAAEDLNSPVIIGFGGVPVHQGWFEKGGLDYQAALGREAVKLSKVPVSFILNEVTLEQALRGIDLGFNIVMADTSMLGFKENIKVTKKLVQAAHRKGVSIEAELGHLPEEGKKDAGILTDPADAKIFVRETGVDALAVSIGNVHTKIKGEASVDMERLKRISKTTKVPLVIHGGSGFPRNKIRDCIKYGAAKFNVGTIMKKVYLEGIKEELAGLPKNFVVQSIVGSRKPTDFTLKGKQNVKEKVKGFIRLLGSAGKA